MQDEQRQSELHAPVAAPKPLPGLTAGHAVVGTSLIVLLVELARSGALGQYKDFLTPFVAWGPGLLIVAGQIWFLAKFAPIFVASQEKVAASLSGLGAAVQASAGALQASRDEQRETIFTLQLLSRKIDEMKSDLADMKKDIADERRTKTVG